MWPYFGEVTVGFMLNEKDVDDIMDTAFYGITYWCGNAEVVGEYLGEFASEQISRGGTIKLHDYEEDEIYELNIEKFINGFKLWIQNGDDEYGALNADGTVDTSEIDAIMADMIIQYAIFGEVIYG